MAEGTRDEGFPYADPPYEAVRRRLPPDLQVAVGIA